jgi:SAM-dependent methyltransferase
MNGNAVDQQNRFEFGKNWKDFLLSFTDERLHEARESLKRFLEVTDLQNKSFVDIGSGSGLFSLAARQLGARVLSFDYDPESVACTTRLREQYFPGDPLWAVEQGSILDRKYVGACGPFDVCYSWGVLHHTGRLREALQNAGATVKPKGLLYIAVYNDQGPVSMVWRLIKKTYCSGTYGRYLMTSLFFPFFFFSGIIADAVRLRNPAARYREHVKKHRGMSLVHDWRDWLGGYPYEPATPRAIIGLYEDLGFTLLKVKPPVHGFGNNEYLFRKTG